MDQPINQDEGHKVETQKKRDRSPDGVSLTPEALTKVGQWIQQLTSHKRGVRVTRGAMVNWVLNARPEKLNVAEVNAIAAVNYDEIRFLQDAIEDLKAKRKGTDI